MFIKLEIEGEEILKNYINTFNFYINAFEIIKLGVIIDVFIIKNSFFQIQEFRRVTVLHFDNFL